MQACVKTAAKYSCQGHCRIRFRPAIPGPLNAVYGWEDKWGKYRTSYRDMIRSYDIIKDRRGYLNRYLGWLPWSASAVSYESMVCSDMDLSGFGHCMIEV